MEPLVTVLQLDTHFPRVPGDVASAETYNGDIEIIRIPSATVDTIVSKRPDLIDIAPFEKAICDAQGQIIVSSCGFLSYWQHHLEQLTERPFISSSLTAFESLSKTFTPGEVLTLTYDESSLAALHFGVYSSYSNEILGLPIEAHLRRVISENLTEINVDLVAQELADLLLSNQSPRHKHLVLECTNLPPYKARLKAETGLEITDILTCVESVQPGTIRSEFLM